MDRRKWLFRLICVRAAVFTVFVAAQVIVTRTASKPDMLVLLGAVYGLSACWFALLKLNGGYVGQSYAQICVDLLLITWTVNRTGGIESYFISLYFLEIVMSSILLGQRGVFLSASASSLIHFAHIDLAYFGFIPSTTRFSPDLPSLQFIVSLSIFTFCVVGYLSNSLAANLRRAGAQLEKSTGKVAFLQAFRDRIIDSMGSGLVTTDLEGRIYLFNRAAEEITGLTSDDALRMTIWQIFPGVVSKLESARFELLTTRRDSKEMYLRFSVTPVMIDEKNTAGHVWCFDDLTDLRVLEREMLEKEQMAAIGTMSAGIAHEIRNPLASISGSFNLLKSDMQTDSEQHQLVEIITRETERLNRIVTDFLAYARPISPKLETLDLSQLLSETMQLIRNSLELKPEHEIATNLNTVQVSADGSLMRQVFYNLASNAFKAMPNGGTLTIGLEARNGGAQIRFADTGIGLSDDEAKGLFVPFHSKFRNGTGLGLPIVYQIVHAHKGKITVKSRKGAGTVFVIDL
jgi:two-component system sensor histidine kinase PilS (NtrC family)